jgi:hypothetical protein
MLSKARPAQLLPASQGCVIKRWPTGHLPKAPFPVPVLPGSLPEPFTLQKSVTEGLSAFSPPCRSDGNATQTAEERAGCRSVPASVRRLLRSPGRRLSRPGPWRDQAAWSGPCRPSGHPRAGEDAAPVRGDIHLPQQPFLGDRTMKTRRSSERCRNDSGRRDHKETAVGSRDPRPCGHRRLDSEKGRAGEGSLFATTQTVARTTRRSYRPKPTRAGMA